MAKCTVCGQEMLLASGCSIPTIFIDGRKYQRVRVGDPGDFYQGGDANIGCTDCGAQMGNYHHWGCDCERCPRCGLQLLTCRCKDIIIYATDRRADNNG